MKTSAFLAMSLDGFIAGKNHELDWLDSVNSTNEDYGYSAFFESVDCLFIGRNTFNKVLEFDQWPYGNKNVYVRTKTNSLHPSVKILSGDLTENIKSIFSDGCKHIYLDGGQLVMDAIRLNQIDQLTISIIPIILGDGIRLFNHHPKLINLKLISSRSYQSGLVQNIYSFQK